MTNPTPTEPFPTPWPGGPTVHAELRAVTDHPATGQYHSVDVTLVWCETDPWVVWLRLKDRAGRVAWWQLSRDVLCGAAFATADTQFGYGDVIAQRSGRYVLLHLTGVKRGGGWDTEIIHLDLPTLADMLGRTTDVVPLGSEPNTRAWLETLYRLLKEGAA